MGAIAIVRFHLAGKSDSGSQALKSLGAIQDWRIAMHEKRMSWWLWPNVLSLDAPIVALVWHLAFARTYEVPVGEVEAALLGLAVWAIYVADRLLDTARANDSEETARHAFHARHRRAFLVGILVALVVAGARFILCEFMPRDGYRRAPRHLPQSFCYGEAIGESVFGLCCIGNDGKSAGLGRHSSDPSCPC